LQIPDISEAITKGVQTALQSIFGKGRVSQFPSNVKPSPRRKRAENQEVKEEKMAELKMDRDFYLVMYNH